MRSMLPTLMFAACVPENSPLMRPGEQCIACHDLPDNSRQWTVAGTAFVAPDSDEGVEEVMIFITDAKGKALTLNSNSAGNFYTAEALVFPIEVAVQRDGVRVAMETKPEHGDCNRCHANPPSEDTPGRVYVPQSDVPQ